MSLNPDQIRQVAHLARLDVKPDQVEAYATQLSNIMALVDALSKTDTSAVSPMAHPLDMHQRLRPDAVTATNARDVFQGIAPAVENGLYLVPKVLE